MKEKEIQFTPVENLKDIIFETITIYPRRKKHKYSKHTCMYFKGVVQSTREIIYFKGDNTDVVELENCRCSIDLIDQNRVRLYHNYGNPNYGFQIIQCYDTLWIK